MRWVAREAALAEQLREAEAKAAELQQLQSASESQPGASQSDMKLPPFAIVCAFFSGEKNYAGE
jgi:hypothetical protein